MLAPEPVVQSSLLSGLSTFLGARGVDLTPLLAANGIEDIPHDQPPREFPLRSVAGVMEEAARLSADPCLGLSWALAYPTGGTGLFGYLVLNAETLSDALANAVRFKGLLFNALACHYEERGSGGDRVGILSWNWARDPGCEDQQLATFMAALFVNRLRSSTMEPWEPAAVNLTAQPLSCASTVRSIFGSTVRFGAGMNELHIPGAALAQRFADADARLHATIRGLAERMVGQDSTSGDIVAAVRRLLTSRLGKHDVTLEAIAGDLDVPTRTLQAKLAQHGGTTFEAILNETRKGLAEHYLLTTDLPLTEIALMLGLSELSAFTRAAQRWFGMAPSAYRQSQRQTQAQRG